MRNVSAPTVAQVKVLHRERCVVILPWLQLQVIPGQICVALVLDISFNTIVQWLVRVAVG